MTTTTTPAPADMQLGAGDLKQIIDAYNEVTERLRSDQRWKSLPCIILTAAGQEQQHRKAMELGATDFLTKPFSPKKLYARAAELSGLGSEEPAAEGS